MRILLVEDETNIATYVKRGLQREGYAVDIALNGNEALGWLAVVQFDLLILDIMLPEIDGLTLCRRLRHTGCHTPILMLTARGEVEDRVSGLDAGADDYLVKPFAFPELLARLRALTRRGIETPKQNWMEMADLRIDTARRQVFRSEKVIDLTAKEYAILECLLREAEHVLTRTQIAEHVWNYDVYNQSNVVDVYIRNLRRKLDDPFPLKLIHTVRGVGYRLAATVEHEPF